MSTKTRKSVVPAPTHLGIVEEATRMLLSVRTAFYGRFWRGDRRGGDDSEGAFVVDKRRVSALMWRMACWESR